MKFSVKLVALLATLAFAVQPLASCFSEEMTLSEEQCCLQMAGACGQVSMPTSHSCCQNSDRPDAARPEAKNSYGSDSLLAVVPAASQDAVLDPAPSSPAVEAFTESPPRPPSASLQILRI